MDKKPITCGRQRTYTLLLLSLVQLTYGCTVGCERFEHAFGTPQPELSISQNISLSLSQKKSQESEFECFNFHTAESQSSSPTLQQNDNHWKLYNTKTTYLNARRHLVENVNITWPVPPPETCRPIYLHFLNRHSIRYPSKKYIREFKERLPALRQAIVDNHQYDQPGLASDFRVWRLLMNEHDDNRLTPSGRYQSAVTAQIFEQYFPELLDTFNSDVVIGVTPKIRTSQTADAFVRSLVESQLMRNGVNESTLQSFETFQALVDEKMSTLPFNKRDVLMSHRHCKSKLEEKHKAIIKAMEAKEMDSLYRSSGMTAMLEQFAARHHFPAGSVDVEDVMLMHRICSFETAIHDSSPWCRLFTNNELKLLTYVLDRLEYHDAYALKPYRQFGCSFVSDLIAGIELYLAQPPPENGGRLRPAATLDFSHENLLSRIISHFALYNDCPAMYSPGGEDSDAADEHVCIPANRQFQSSLLTPFGANFAFVLYECQNPPSGQDSSAASENPQDSSVQHKLLVLHNEVPVRVAGCSEAFCDLDEFRRKYLTDHCNLDEICRHV